MRGNFPELREPQLGLGSGPGGRMGGPDWAASILTLPKCGARGFRGPQGAKRGEEGEGREEHFCCHKCFTECNWDSSLFFETAPPSRIGRHKEKPPARARAHTHTHTHKHAGPAGPDVWALAAS